MTLHIAKIMLKSRIVVPVLILLFLGGILIWYRIYYNNTMQQTISREEAIQIARKDAEGDYNPSFLENAAVTLEDDGWHVDLELVNMPYPHDILHYIIDAKNGGIISKTKNSGTS